MRATLYFDGKCPVCRREMTWLERLKSDDLRLQDVHTAALEDTARQRMLRVLHLRFDDGRWARGVEASVAAWSYTRWGFLWRPLLWPGVAFVSRRVYRCWARRRGRRLSWIRCPQGVCDARADSRH